MSPVYRTVTRTSYGQNIKGSFTAALVGLALFIGSFYLLSWNEGNSVKIHAALNWAEANLNTASPQPLDGTLDGKVIYLTGEATTRETLTEDVFQLSQSGVLRLQRFVEMYQWKEEKSTHSRDKLGGGTETVTEYRYHKIWSDDAINSGRFNQTNYANPPMPFTSQTLNARQAKLGDYQMTDDILGKLSDFSMQITPPTVTGYRTEGNTLYKGTDPANPQIGDLRITFAAVPSQTISIIGQQSTARIIAAKAPSDRSVLLVDAGEVAPAVMFKQAHDDASLLTWVLRAAGFLLMWVGLGALLSPLKALAKVIPPLGWVVGFGISTVAFITALILSLGTIAIAWFTYRPALSGALLAGAVVVGLTIMYLRRPKARVVGVAPN